MSNEQNASTVPPDYLLGLSIHMGVDLTPNEDLQERLDAASALARECQRGLEETERLIRRYELTVDGHEPVPLRFLDEIQQEIVDERTSTNVKKADS